MGVALCFQMETIHPIQIQLKFNEAKTASGRDLRGFFIGSSHGSD